MIYDIPISTPLSLSPGLDLYIYSSSFFFFPRDESESGKSYVMLCYAML